MLRIKHALFLSLLLLVFAGGWVVMDAPCSSGAARGPVSFAALPDAREKEHAAAVWEHGDAALHPAGQRTPAAAKSAGDGGDAPHSHWRKWAALLPATFSPTFFHSKAALKQRRYAPLSRAECQQRLALFPKHGFR